MHTPTYRATPPAASRCFHRSIFVSRSPAACCTRRLRCSAEKDSKPGDKSSLQLKAAWYGAELFGKIMGGSKVQDSSNVNLEAITWDTALKEIRADFDNNYFVSGDAEMLAYDPQCLFADPFTSFRGVDRFKQNLTNFSKFTHGREGESGACRTDVKCDVTGWEELGDRKLKVSWRFKCILEVPWRPILAAAGSTTYVGSVETGRILEHIEAWDVEPEQVLKRLLKPSNKRVAEDGTAIEQFMDAASRGDFAKGWSVAALPMLVVLVPDALLTSGASYVFQQGGLGAFLFALQIALWGLCGACAVTVAANKLQSSRS